MAINSFKCLQCGEFTQHVEISFREFCALAGDGIATRTVAAFGELSGINKAFAAVSGVRCWKCCKCGDATRRKLNGEVYEGFESSDSDSSDYSSGDDAYEDFMREIRIFYPCG